MAGENVTMPPEPSFTSTFPSPPNAGTDSATPSPGVNDRAPSRSAGSAACSMMRAEPRIIGSPCGSSVMSPPHVNGVAVSEVNVWPVMTSLRPMSSPLFHGR